MKNKSTLVVAIVTLLLIFSMGGVAIYSLFFAPEQTVSVSSDPFSKLLPFSDSKNNASTPVVNKNNQTLTNGATSTISIRTLNGFVDVRDFTKDAGVATTTEGDAFYVAYPAEDTFSYKNLEYEIDYIPNEHRVSILIYKEPIGDIRRKASDDLAKRLGLAPAELCTLDVLVVAPRWVNEYYADKNLGFPGCPGVTGFNGDPVF